MGDKGIIVFDLDGVLWDDVQMKLRKHLRTTSTPLAQAYCEFIVTPLSAFPSLVARHTSSLKKGVFVQEAVHAARKLASEGWEIVIRTGNPVIDTSRLTKLLAKNKVPIKFVEESTSLSDKANKIDGASPILVEDNPIVAFKAARRGCRVVLVVKDYNRFSSWLVGRLNENVERIRTVGETPMAVGRILRRPTLSKSISMA